MRKDASADRLVPMIRPRMSTCDRFESIVAGRFLLAMGRGNLITAAAVLPWRTAHDAPEGGAEGAFGFVANSHGDGGDRIVGIDQLVASQQHSPARQVFHRRGP